MILPLLALTAACAAEPPAELSAEAQSELNVELAGRTAGDPQMCVRQADLTSNRSVGPALVFGTRGRNVIYVNRADCPELDTSRALKTRTTTGQLCAGDIVEVFDPVAGFSYGSCGLQEFTPYRRQG
jgi:hypothetical protein